MSKGCCVSMTQFIFGFQGRKVIKQGTPFSFIHVDKNSSRERYYVFLSKSEMANDKMSKCKLSASNDTHFLRIEFGVLVKRCLVDVLVLPPACANYLRETVSLIPVEK
jgi:hypothetical protein